MRERGPIELPRVLLQALLIAVCAAWHHAQAQTNGTVPDDPVARFGTETLEQESEAILFFNGRHVPAPFTIERRGLDIYVNGHLVSPGPEWPVRDWREFEDPGPVPSDWTPFDRPANDPDDPMGRRISYWSQHFDGETARRLWLETLASLDNVEHILPCEDLPNAVLVKWRQREEPLRMGFGPIPEHQRWRSQEVMAQTPEEFMEDRAREQASYVERRLDELVSKLAVPRIVLIDQDVQFSAQPDESVSIVEVLLQHGTSEARAAALTELGLPVGSDVIEKLADAEFSRPELAAQYERIAAEANQTE